ncbi:hypothetical protein QFC19_003399 [Naganishia cerealis]|uniref:Uncharacterized protein n=1 Tax=Naganishia cerealis TaxID=610337 RepID=A0ACC2W3H3_9TREE|nr:hypothetical protein QFC19_003399 [Naganishia cerealis]
MARTLNITIDDFDPLIGMPASGSDTSPSLTTSLLLSFSLRESLAAQYGTKLPTIKQTFQELNSGSTLQASQGGIMSIIRDAYTKPALSDQPYTTNITTSNALASTADSSSRATLFSTTSLSSNAQLSCAQHEVIVRNVGLQEGKGTGVLGVDLVIIGGIPVGGEGATLTNTTIDDPDAALKYTGSWTTNNVTDFWGGSSVYTNTPGDAVALSFAGSAVYVYGDQVNDHGYYSILINNTQMANLSGRSGCAGSDGEKQCEKLGGLHFFAGGLPEGQHDLRIVNGGSSGNQTYFGKALPPYP